MVDHLHALAEAQRRFAHGLAAADPEAQVPSCEPWRVADLALHLAGVHWWAAAMAHGVDLDSREPPGPRDTPTLVAFYTWAADALLRTLTDLPPDAAALTLEGPGQARFWHRRQLHETVVHLWDLDAAAGTELSDLGPEVWADTVAEVVDTMTPRQVRLGRIAPLSHPVDLAAGPDRAWRLGPPGTPVVTVHGPPRELALLAWRRIGPDHPGLTVAGDHDALTATLALRLVP